MAYAISKWDKYCVYHFSWLKKKMYGILILDNHIFGQVIVWWNGGHRRAEKKCSYFVLSTSVTVFNQSISNLYKIDRGPSWSTELSKILPCSKYSFVGAAFKAWVNWGSIIFNKLQ
jgi:hypothetical protein